MLTIEKPIEMPQWNLSCPRRIRLFGYIFSTSKNKITKLYANKFGRLLVNCNKIVK